MKKHILFVEDEVHTQLSLSIILRSAGYQVTTANSGYHALQHLLNSESEPIDLLLTDIKLPDIDGIELLNLMNKNGVMIPTVAITGFGNKDVVINLMRSGCRDYLEKPFKAQELLACLEKVFNTIDAEQSRQAENKLAKDRESKLSGEMETYKLNLDKLRAQMATAVNVYHELIDLSAKTYPLLIAWKNRPLMELGGDFIGIEQHLNQVDILIADVAGHDMGSSFHTILIKAFFQENAHKGNDGSTLFQLMNRQLMESGKNERMVTAIFIRIDLDQMTAELITAGHPPLIYLKKHSEYPQIISTGGPVLGICDMVDFNVKRFPIESQDRLFLYTDGVPGMMSLDTKTGYFEKLSVSGLEKIILQHRKDHLEDAVSHIWDDLLQYCEDKPCDDVLLLGVEIP